MVPAWSRCFQALDSLEIAVGIFCVYIGRHVWLLGWLSFRIVSWAVFTGHKYEPIKDQADDVSGGRTHSGSDVDTGGTLMTGGHDHSAFNTGGTVLCHGHDRSAFNTGGTLSGGGHDNVSSAFNTGGTQSGMTMMGCGHDRSVFNTGGTLSGGGHDNDKVVPNQV